MAEQEIRISVLKRLAEQAMSDGAFRVAAREDLDGALLKFGYHLNDVERPLVHRFRDALAEAGVDLTLASELAFDLDDDMTVDDIHRLESAFQDSSQ